MVRRIVRSLKNLFARLLPDDRRKKNRRYKMNDRDESRDWWCKYFASLEVGVHADTESVTRVIRCM